MTDIKKKTRAILLTVCFILFQGLSACNTDGRDPGDTTLDHTDAVPLTSAPATPTPEPEFNVDTDNKLEVHFMDAGEGECTLVFTPDGKTLLVDGGTADFGQAVITFLRSRNVRKLDIVVSSHPDADRIGGLAALIKEFRIGRFFAPPVGNDIPEFSNMLAAMSDADLNQETANAGLEVPLGAQVQLKFLAPMSTGYDHLNDYSVMLQVIYGNTRILFTGDAESVSEKQVLSSGSSLASTVLKVGNNGASASTSQEFLTAVAPMYAVIFTKPGDEAVPSKILLDKLNQLKVKWYKTGECGIISFYSDGTNIELKTQKSPPKRT
ncbi:MAG TPA: hypothetical protein DD727_07585 [Clostridiales bacterium]|nr:hypothetical protein [Clostridiales bacterium]